MPDQYIGSHEIQSRKAPVKQSSDRGFGLVFSAFFAIVSTVSLYHGRSYWPWLLAAGICFGLAYGYPRVLAPLNLVWTKLGLLLFAFVSPIALGIIFYLCIAPIGLLARLLGKDLLSLRLDPKVDSYWIRRDPVGPEPETLKRQF